MAITPTIAIAAIGATAAVGGTAYSVYNGQKQAGVQGQIGQNQFQIGQLQTVGADVQAQAQARTIATQTELLGAQREQSLLSIDTNKKVIGFQQQLEALKQQGNVLNNNFNSTSRNAAAGIEALNQQNDVINQQSDIVDAKAENLQRTLAALSERRSQRQAIRQGVVAQASGLVKGVASGVGTDSSATANVRAQAANEAGLIIQGASQQRQAAFAGVDLQQQKRELGVESRGLGVQARGINYGLAQGRFDLADQQFDLTNQMFGVQNSITNTYLNAQDKNATNVNTAYELNSKLLNENTGSQEQLTALQKSIFSLGGNNSLLSASAASFGGMASLGTGIASLGNSLINNTEKISKISEEPFFSTFFSNGPSGSGDVFKWT